MNDTAQSTMKLTERQQEVLNWIKDGCPEGVYLPEEFGHKTTARALHNRGLVRISGQGSTWSAALTERGKAWPEAADHDLIRLERERTAARVQAEQQRLAAKAKEDAERAEKAQQTARSGRALPRGGADKQSAGTRRRRASGKPDPEPEFTVVSPAEARRRGGKPRGDRLTGGTVDPWDEKILITVKEAAWMLSLTEGAIREAVKDGDLQRVFIGRGTMNYRVVYGSLLAWVDSMPREPGVSKLWWR